MKPEKIGFAMRRALLAVEAGNVVRLSDSKRSRYQGPKGVGPQTLQTAYLAKLIQDGDRKRSAMTTTWSVVLTDTGRAALETGVFQ